MIEVMEPIQIADLKKAILVPLESFEAWLARWDWTWHQLSRGEYPGEFSSTDEFQLACICADPILWCQAFLREPEDPDHLSPYNFFDYQIAAIRHRENKVYDCAAETGKTRDIVADNLYSMFTTPGGSGLVAAPQQTHLDEIIEAMYDQMSWNPDLLGSLKRWKKHPHHAFYLDNGFKVDFRPAGHDGEAFRGVHVRTFAKIDEAAKMKNPRQWSEFWRAMKPGCIASVYSVTDGDRSCDFYKLKERAKRAAANQDITEDLAQDLPVQMRNLNFTHFCWPKTMMPPPFWSPERRKFYIDQYGGEDSPGYRHNVLAEDGDPENSVFPWYSFSRLLKDIPEYRLFKIMVDSSQGEVVIAGMKYMPQESVVRSQESGEQRETKPEERVLCEKRIPVRDFDIRKEIKSFFSNTPGLKFGGADLGFSQDPTEIYVKLIIGNTHRLIARVQLKGVTYDQQCECIDALDDVFDAGQNKMGWGVDYGNAGSAVVHILQNQALYEAKRYEDRMTGYQFGGTYEAVDENGEILMDRHTDKPVKLSGKELSTDLLVKKMQRIELEYPYDPDIILFYPNHSYREGERHRIYKKEDDHVIDADRALTLRVILPGDGSGVDVFASGVNYR
jgi:hypothetical protein